MSYEADKRYDGKVVDWDFWEPSGGDMALTIDVQANGQTETLRHFLWLGKESVERTAKTLAEFGIDAKDAGFWEEMEAEEPSCRLVGQLCNFTTKLGKTGKVQTQYVNGPLRAKGQSGATDKRAAAGRARSLFAGTSTDTVAF